MAIVRSALFRSTLWPLPNDSTFCAMALIASSLAILSEWRELLTQAYYH